MSPQPPGGHAPFRIDFNTSSASSKRNPVYRPSGKHLEQLPRVWLAAAHMAVFFRIILDWLAKGVAASLASGCRERHQELPRRGQSFQPDRIGGAYVPAHATSCTSQRIDPETAIAFQAYRTMLAHFGATAAAHALPCIETDAPRQQTRRSRQPVCHQHVAFLRFPCRMRTLLMRPQSGNCAQEGPSALGMFRDFHLASPRSPRARLPAHHLNFGQGMTLQDLVGVLDVLIE